MKYKAGDKVRIKSREWYIANRDNSGRIELPISCFIVGMDVYCGTVLTIAKVFSEYYEMKDDDGYNWTDEMIEGIAKGQDKELDLVEILKDCPAGTQIYCSAFGDVIVDSASEEDETITVSFMIRDAKYSQIFSRYGNLFVHATKKYNDKLFVCRTDFANGECILFPSKDCRDWRKFKAPLPKLPVGTPCMVCRGNANDWSLRYYSGNSDCFICGDDSKTIKWNYIIPLDKFDFKNPDTNLTSKWNYGMEGGNVWKGSAIFPEFRYEKCDKCGKLKNK